LKLKTEKLHSNFGFKFNLRCYIEDEDTLDRFFDARYLKSSSNGLYTLYADTSGGYELGDNSTIFPLEYVGATITHAGNYASVTLEDFIYQSSTQNAFNAVWYRWYGPPVPPSPPPPPPP
jgi:hypothetical protein